MQIKRFEFNPFQANTYLLYDDTKEAIIIDATMMYDQEKELFSYFLKTNNLALKGVYNTHGHLDHIAGTHWIKQNFNISPAGHKADDMLISTAQTHAESYGLSIEKPEPVSLYLTEDDIIQFGNQELSIQHIPGHSPGGLAFIHHKERIIFSGDSLFALSIGRTDLPGGNYSTLINSIQKKLLSLQDDYIVYPGHGTNTTIQKEKQENPFLS